MNFEQYQAAAQRTADATRATPERLHVAVMGLCSEAGEIASETKKAVEQGREINVAKVAEEISDTLWYAAEVCSALGLWLDECASANIAKLWRRYPGGFTPADSVARRDEE
jgi:NTP pyrophosphatase (non-canonical NTP hydrolase)